MINWVLKKSIFFMEAIFLTLYLSLDEKTNLQVMIEKTLEKKWIDSDF